MEFKERLKTLRKEQKLTQSDLGKILNYGYTAISNYESGRNQPSISDLKTIASYFGVSMDYLLCVNDEKHPYVERQAPEEFDELKNIYSALNVEKRATSLEFMRWLLDTQSKPAARNLRVAQETIKYRTMPSNKE